MNNFIFENATKVYFGRGCVKEYLACVLEKYGQTIMLAYGNGSIKQNGIYEEVIEILQNTGKKIIEFPRIMPNPTYQKVMEGALLAKEQHVDFILAVGGGSVMDCAKAIALASTSKEDIWENYWTRLGIIDFDPLPLGAIVTVAGTGSEMNGVAVITNERLNVKKSRDYSKCHPHFAMLDPVYTYSVPIQQLTSGSFDILSHLMEVYFSEPEENNISDDLSEALMRGVIRDIRLALNNPKDYTARSNLMWASTMSGNGIIKLGKKLDFKCQQEAFTSSVKKFKKFAVQVWGIAPDSKTDEEVARLGIAALAEFVKEIGLQTTVEAIMNK